MCISDWSSDVCSSDLAAAAAEVADVAVARVDAHAHHEGGLKAARAAPVDVELDQAALHRHRHAQAGARVLDDTLGLGVAEEGEDGIADALIHRRAVRSEERRVGKEWVSTCRSRLSPDH